MWTVPVPFEAVALANELVHDVDLDARVGSQVLDRPGRSDVGEDQVVVVPHRGRALRREVGRAVRTHGGDEAELGLDDSPHVVGEDPHDPSLRPGRILRNRMRRGQDGTLLTVRASQPDHGLAASSRSTVGPLPSV